jgi:transposase
MKQTYSQDWAAYNRAQTGEKTMFMYLLHKLCSNIEQPPYRFGRPNLQISDMVFCSALKVYTTYSGRRFTSDMQIAEEMGYVGKVPHYNSVFNYLKRPEMTSVLHDLITQSSMALKSVETDFAVDSTGFSTSQFGRWFSFKYGRGLDTRIWLKAHLMCGVKTNIVTSVEVTSGTESDIRQFGGLVAKTAENFRINEVSADKAYSSRENLHLIEEMGGSPFIPFRSNARPRAGGSAVWRRMWYFYNLHRKEFLQHYHKRSNVESTVFMIKAKFGGNIRSRIKTAQVNEILTKVLCHNICVVIQEIHELQNASNIKFKYEE